MAYQAISQRPTQPRPRGQSSPGFVSFSRILDANRPGATRMADQLAGSVQQQGQQVTQAIQQTGQDFSKKVKAGTITPYTSSYNITRGTAMAGGGGYGQAGAASVGIQAGPNAKEYQGPKDWAGAGYDVAGLTSQAIKAGDAAKGLTTMGGRAAQLKEMAGGPYSAGMGTLDAALSGAALGSRGRDLSAMYGNLSQQLADMRVAGDKEVAGAITASDQAVNDAEQEGALWDRLQSPAPAPALPSPTSPPPPPVDGITWDWNGREWVPIPV